MISLRLKHGMQRKWDKKITDTHHTERERGREMRKKGFIGMRRKRPFSSPHFGDAHLSEASPLYSASRGPLTRVNSAWWLSLPRHRQQPSNRDELEKNGKRERKRGKITSALI
jgi:hypothetical protein